MGETHDSRTADALQREEVATELLRAVEHHGEVRVGLLLPTARSGRGHGGRARLALGLGRALGSLVRLFLHPLAVHEEHLLTVRGGLGARVLARSGGSGSSRSGRGLLLGLGRALGSLVRFFLHALAIHEEHLLTVRGGLGARVLARSGRGSGRSNGRGLALALALALELVVERLVDEHVPDSVHDLLVLGGHLAHLRAGGDEKGSALLNREGLESLRRLTATTRAAALVLRHGGGGARGVIALRALGGGLASVDGSLGLAAGVCHHLLALRKGLPLEAACLLEQGADVVVERAHAIVAAAAHGAMTHHGFLRRTGLDGRETALPSRTTRDFRVGGFASACAPRRRPLVGVGAAVGDEDVHEGSSCEHPCGSSDFTLPCSTSTGKGRPPRGGC